VKEETFSLQASINRICELATRLDHPGTVRLRDDVGDLHASRREVDHEQDGDARQPSSGPDFGREEIRGREDASMRAQELRPGRPPLPLRRGLDPELFQSAGDGASTDVVIQIGERTLNPGIAPRAVLGRHPDGPLADRLLGARPSRAATQVAVVLAGDQRPMPREQGVRCHDGPDLRQRTSTERFGFSEPRHGARGTREFLSSILYHPRFAGTVNDIVVEFGNARYQDIADQYIAGLPVRRDQLKQIWEETTVVTGVWTSPIYEGFLSDVRSLNLTLPAEKRVRVVLGDPPIDWSVVRGPADEDMNDWRDAHFAWVVEEQVLKKGRRALLWIGGAHLGRRVRLPDVTARLQSHAARQGFRRRARNGWRPALLESGEGRSGVAGLARNCPRAPRTTRLRIVSRFVGRGHRRRARCESQGGTRAELAAGEL
jgi:hypothetical protein